MPHEAPENLLTAGFHDCWNKMSKNSRKTFISERNVSSSSMKNLHHIRKTDSLLSDCEDSLTSLVYVYPFRLWKTFGHENRRSRLFPHFLLVVCLIFSVVPFRFFTFVVTSIPHLPSSGNRRHCRIIIQTFLLTFFLLNSHLFFP